MTSIDTIKTLEKRYNVHIDRDFYFASFGLNELRESFNIYSADGCCWDRVLGYRSLVSTLAKDKKALKKITPMRCALDDSEEFSIEYKEKL